MTLAVKSTFNNLHLLTLSCFSILFDFLSYTVQVTLEQKGQLTYLVLKFIQVTLTQKIKKV